jgi:hypothetical protein
VTDTGIEPKDAIMVFLFCLLALTLQSFAQIEDDRSTTGPKPPKGVDVLGYVSKAKAFTSQNLISGVPVYLWKDGCGPTVVGMIAGYYDSHGFSDLLAGDSSTQTASVNKAISSDEHFNDYALPIESALPVIPDKSELPVGDEHVDNCIADYMKTSQSVVGNIYGWSFGRDIKPSWEKYITNKASNYIGLCNEYYYNSSTWDTLLSNIDRAHPMVLLVDTDGNGVTDHFVLANGYQIENGINYYGCYNTWDSDQHWYAFAQMANGVQWGVSRCYTFHIQTNLPYAAESITGPSAVCIGQSQVLYSVPLIGNADSYIWSLPTGATGASTTNSILVSFSSTAYSGTIKVKGHNNAGDGAESALIITFNEIPPTPVVMLNNSTLQSSSSLGNQWYFNDIMIINATNDTYLPSQNGNYYAIVTLNSCSSLPSNIIPYMLTDIYDISSTDKINVYPNPTNGELSIEGLPTDKESEITIYNIYGKLMRRYTIFGNIGNIVITNDEGVYLLVINNIFKQTIKIIKE